MQKIVSYIRVSTRRQGESGLGLEAQRAAVRGYADQHGSRILAEFVEVESGKIANRPELAKALAQAKRHTATLVVAKLDRLARNVAFTAALLESGVEFICCDNPTATRLTIHILAAVAEDEARRISERTKAALAAAKSRGQKLGGARPECRNLTAESRQRGSSRGAEAVRAAAEEAYRELGPLLVQMRQSGLSFRDMAAFLNAAGHATRQGKPWSDATLFKVCRRLGIGPEPTTTG